MAQTTIFLQVPFFTSFFHKFFIKFGRYISESSKVQYTVGHPQPKTSVEWAAGFFSPTQIGTCLVEAELNELLCDEGTTLLGHF